jgi:predicted RNA-binding Zn ribbon-like protein
MDLLNDLLGGEKKQDYDDFVQRYDQGSPWDNIDDDEAQRRYQEVAPRLDDDQYTSSAEEAFRNLTPEQRAEFGRWLESKAQASGVDARAQDLADPHELATMTSRVRREQPNILDQLLGGGSSDGGGLLSSPIAKAAIGGIAAIAVRKLMGR